MATRDDSIRVLEYAGPGNGIAGAYAGWLLARMGAAVTRFGMSDRPPGADHDSPLALARDALAAGKTALELPAAGAARDALIGEYDVLLCDALTDMEALLGPHGELLQRLPRLVLGVASHFGLDGPYAGQPSAAIDAQALGAVAWSIGDPAREPLTLPAGVLEHQSGAVLAAGALLALSMRDERGSGRVVDVALADVLASYVAGNCRVYIHHGLKWHRNGERPYGCCGAYPFAILPCLDGKVCISGRTREEWLRLVKVMGNPAWAEEPRYQDLRTMGTQYPDEVDALLKPWFAARTRSELQALALEHNLILAPLRDFSEVLDSPQFASRDFLQPATVAGRAVRAPALPFRVTARRAADAPDLAAGLLRPAAAATTPLGRGDRPLGGLRVLDFGWVWSAPWVGTMLGELGAQVIKVEHGQRPDNLRMAGRVVREDGSVVPGPTREMSPMYHQVNHGKLGITLNVKDPRAVQLALRLAAKSDAAVENMSPGSMERSALGFEALRAVNPRLVMLSMSAAGQFGPYANMRAYAPTMSAFAGLESLVGYAGETPIGTLNFAIGDPNASVHGLLALLAALRHARATGQGAHIDLSQVEALIGSVRPYLLDAQVRGRQPLPQGNGHPEMAPHGIYPAAGEDRWITLAVASEAQWQSLVHLVGDLPWAREPQHRTLAGRLANREALDRAIAAWSRPQTREQLVARLRAAGIAASPVLSVQEQWRDPHMQGRRLMHPVEIPHYGPENMFRAPWRFSDAEPVIDRCGPRLGEHNELVFGELLGLASSEINALIADGVIA